ncbi:MAG: murein biosynthesis integral membrane protein MurJ [Puniceicoccales bacterium]|jgi:putative peptidoglycan lipid II flippase|nr:murein biosynthesis integral membrane protein MurJ [Puniceicoccales bacterium]
MHYKKMFLTASGTLGSRVLGLVRDQLTAAFFGTGMVASALLFALQVPNLFRRLLGEGALTSAIIPVLTDEFAKDDGRARGFRFLNLVLARAAVLLCLLTLAAVLLAWGLSEAGWLEERHRLAARLTMLCMPYMPLICLAAVFSAGLYVLSRFGVTSLSAVWLNLAMISALTGGGYLFGARDTELAVWVCCGSLAGGLAQLAVPMLALWREGWRPAASRKTSASAPDHTLRERELAAAWAQLKLTFLPTVAGAGIHQINLFFSRFLAIGADDQAMSVFYLANRLVELPTGLFSVSIATVIFPAMSKCFSDKNLTGAGDAFAHGIRLILAVTLPAAAGLLVLAEPIVRLLFEYGKFDSGDTRALLPVLWVFALAMPLTGLIALMARAFNVVKQVRILAKTALWVFLLNVAIAPLLAWQWQATGLAAASLATTLFQFVVFLFVLRRGEAAFARQSFAKPLLQCLAATLAMAAFAWGAWQIGGGLIPAADGAGGAGTGAARVLATAFVLAGVIILSAAFYFALLRAMRFPEIKNLGRRRPPQF